MRQRETPFVSFVSSQRLQADKGCANGPAELRVLVRGDWRLEHLGERAHHTLVLRDPPLS